MGNMRFKAGDRVRIKSFDWYNENKNKTGFICFDHANFIPEMSRYCGEILTINRVVEEFEQYLVLECAFSWTDEMIEGLVEEKTLIERFDDNGLPFNEWLSHKGAFHIPDGYELKDENGNVINATKIVLEKKPDDKLKLESTKKVREYWSEYARIYIEIYDNEPNECVLTHLYTLEGHRQKGYGRQALIEAELIAKELGCHTAYLKVETNSWMHEWYLRMGYKWYKTADKEYTWLVKNLTSIEEKKKEYPKTYEECCYITGFENTEMVFEDDYRDINPPKEQWKRLGLMNQLNKLLICRDAYWKIAGEEMGLGKPWKPDWKDDTTHKFIIHTIKDKIHCGVSLVKNHLLAFPTEEMRDAFYENFKEEIEICKEIL